MLARVLIVLLLQALSTQIGFAAPMVANELSGRQVNALYAGYEALPTDLRSDFAEDKVDLTAAGGGKVGVTFLFPKGVMNVIVDDAGKVSVASTTRKRSAQASVALTGGDAKAIVSAYEAWISRSVPCQWVGCKKAEPEPSALRSGAYTVREYFVADSGPTEDPAYAIHYFPPGASLVVRPGPNCAAGAGYSVDATTWEVFREPPIC